jgi:acyl-protein synthetase LuxE
VAENQPTTKNRMNKELSNFAVRLRESIANLQFAIRDSQFSGLALELFTLQFQHNTAYRKICEARDRSPGTVEHWTHIPAVPTAAFKELELTCLAPPERTAVFHSSGTTEQKPSRHFHCPASLELYESSLWSWFGQNVAPDLRFTIYDLRLLCLTPSPEQAPHSSLVHMFETVRQKMGGAGVLASRAEFFGRIASDGSWTLDFDAVLAALEDDLKLKTQNSKLILGTAFSFVHLLDYLAERNLRFQLPPGSRVMETGGYKNRSRSMPKAELHALITERLGVPSENIICEYGMSELSSQAYALTSDRWQVTREAVSPCHLSPVTCHFHSPPWARVQIISPETGHEVADGETGLIRVYDLANVFSVMAVQTEDLGIRWGDGFELIGRAQFAESRGCSLMMDEPLALAFSPPGGERVVPHSGIG